MTPMNKFCQERIEPWSGDAFIKPREYALYLGLAADTEKHSMHVHQLIILLDGEMRVHVWNKCRFPLRGSLQLEGETIIELAPGRPLLIPPDYPIQLEGCGNAAIFFLTPEIASAEGLLPTHQLRCSLTELLPASVESIVERLGRYLTNRYSKKDVSLLCAEMAGLLTSLGERVPLYWVVRLTLKCLLESFENDKNSNIATIRECISHTRATLNEFHIQREFSKHVGVAIRRFSIALRLWDSVEEMAYRKNLDDVTAAVDFAKGMLSRYFKRVIGISPSTFYHRGKVVVLS